MKRDNLLLSLILLFLVLVDFSVQGQVSISNRPADQVIVFGNNKLRMKLDYNQKCIITQMEVNGEPVISEKSGIFSEIRTPAATYSTRELASSPKIKTEKNRVTLSQISYGDDKGPVTETWTFLITETDIKFNIERTVLKPFAVEEVSFPSVNFNNIHTWDGAFLGYGGLAWFYLFNEKLCTYGVHSGFSAFWNSATGNGLKVSASSPGKQVASKFTRSANDELCYALSVSDNEMTYRYEPPSKRSRFIRKKTDVWDSFTVSAGKYVESVNFSWFNYREEYDRSHLAGLNGNQVTNLLNTVARIGVIDAKLFGGNSWHTPYGPICLHEQYIAQLGVAINDKSYLEGYRQCLDYYRDKAIQPDGRVISRWAYLDIDAMPGKMTPDGFYEAQWGYLLDSNPDFVTNISELYAQNGDLNWVMGHKKGCERALDYLLKRDSNKNYLVEMMTDDHSGKKSSDWIDIVWASFENAFVNAKLYYALTLWSDIEKQLGDTGKANYYSNFASQLKASFNKSTDEGGFWDKKNKWYVHWLDKDGSVHGDNLVMPVNFMAIAYNICDDEERKKAILDKVEAQMQMENLFFWPICLYSYEKGEAKENQYPFPFSDFLYENGDIFLSWGAIGVEAYASYKPEIALKYIENVLARYEKDGLAFQRYGRLKQDGLGDDILSGNSLSIVGLYKSIYGINPMYNRLYLNPHLPDKLSGTILNYDFRGERLLINLDKGRYSISNNQFKLTSPNNFGCNAGTNELEYFNSNNDTYSLKVHPEKTGNLSVEIVKWNENERVWIQTAISGKGKIIYSVCNLVPDNLYVVLVNGQIVKSLKSNKEGRLTFDATADKNSSEICIQRENNSQWEPGDKEANELTGKFGIPVTDLKNTFLNPPDSARPGVYWYFMDGNLSKEAMTADLESMKAAGIGNLVFLEVNVGIPRGEVDFLSEQWQDLFKHAVREAERLGIAITLGVGPGWTGSGGPWVLGKESMKHLVASTIQVSGDENKRIILPKPAPKKPYFGEGGFTPELRGKWEDYYEDVAVLAFTTPSLPYKIKDIDEKALYYRAPYTSVKGVKQFLPSQANYQEPQREAVVAKDQVIDVTRFLKPDGTLEWKVPTGNWTIMRLGSRNNGAVTRPAPLPGVGFEADKFDTVAINAHLENFTGKLLKKIGTPDKNLPGGLKMLHMDSWEMGAQNWSHQFREEFQKRRGYDPLPFYPVYSGFVVESLVMSERFLWDLRQTAQELVVENHATHLKKYGQRYNLGFSIEPYDMNPTADMELGAVADVPMCEFWSKDYGFNSSFSCIQAASIAHVEGKKVVAAEAFTASRDAWKQYPGSMKNQGDWAFAAGVNRFVYHTFQHQFLADSLKPGMTMGPYGVHWDRSQTWWPMANGYHRYITRCQYILQQGQPVADILYLTPEGAPHVFRAPASAFTGDEILPDRRGYNFDGCSPSQLFKASVKDNRISFPGGAIYRLLVLPAIETMTPALLDKIESLVKAGAIIVGNPPRKSPGLANYPACDQQVDFKAKLMWGKSVVPNEVSERPYGKGKIFWGGNLSKSISSGLYPNYDATALLLLKMGIKEDFESTGPIRYTHHHLETGEIYFVSNKTNSTVNTLCKFRSGTGTPELWYPLTGEIRLLPDFTMQDERMQIPLQFEPYQSFFIVIDKEGKPKKSKSRVVKNFPRQEVLMEVKGPWNVSFDPKWGGPKEMTFLKLEEWTTRPEDGIRYYSGIANYHDTINLPENVVADKKADIFLDLGEVYNLARIRVNGKDMGVVWIAPFQLKITDAVLPGKNTIDIEVANLWPNRLIGDEQLPDDGIKNREWPAWLVKKQSRTSGRVTFYTAKFYQKDSGLLKSGLIGPVRIIVKSRTFNEN